MQPTKARRRPIALDELDEEGSGGVELADLARAVNSRTDRSLDVYAFKSTIVDSNHVYRRDVGDGQARTPQPLGAAEFCFRPSLVLRPAREIPGKGACREKVRARFDPSLAGGGIRGGIVVGATDKHAADPTTTPFRPSDYLATVFACLGFPPETIVRSAGTSPELGCVSLYDGHLVRRALGQRVRGGRDGQDVRRTKKEVIHRSAGTSPELGCVSLYDGHLVRRALGQHVRGGREPNRCQVLIAPLPVAR